jgi:hypothetical protein
MVSITFSSFGRLWSPLESRCEDRSHPDKRVINNKHFRVQPLWFSGLHVWAVNKSVAVRRRRFDGCE